MLLSLDTSAGPLSSLASLFSGPSPLERAAERLADSRDARGRGTLLRAVGDRLDAASVFPAPTSSAAYAFPSRLRDDSAPVTIFGRREPLTDTDRFLRPIRLSAPIERPLGLGDLVNLLA